MRVGGAELLVRELKQRGKSTFKLQLTRPCFRATYPPTTGNVQWLGEVTRVALCGKRLLKKMKSSNLSKAGTLAARLGKLMLVNPRGLREVSGVALWLSGEYVDPEIDVLPIPVVTLDELVASAQGTLSLNVLAFPQERFSITLQEAMGLAVLMALCGAKRAFEFGTHRGVSTSQLARNVPDDGGMVTLDLPREDKKRQFTVDDAAEIEVAAYPNKGDLIPDALRKKVTFLAQDSARFDPKPYAGSMDFVFVDAAHTPEYVRNDSEKAWEMLRPEGIVAWHDCRPQSPDVVRYLRACPFPVRRIHGTTLAFAVKPKT
jgi:predicted O-methyltransferase YrrM